MTRFLDVRASAVGGGLASGVAVNKGTQIADYRTLDLPEFLSDIAGRHVLIAIHGFNVDRAAGIACLANWERLLQLPPQSAFLGLLWPGDSVWLHALDYPEEPRIADDAGSIVAGFVDANLARAASVSFASHSLGARVLLSIIGQVKRASRRALIMAGAIDDDCLAREFQSAAEKTGEVSILASAEDEVLALAFPLGNFLGGVLTDGHPWMRAALGQRGPSVPFPLNVRAPYQIPDNWNFGHGDYLQLDAPSPAITVPTDVPPNGTPPPALAFWQAAWTAAFASTRFR